MAEGIYSPSGQNKVYARNRFGRKLLASLPVNSIHAAGDPEGEFSALVSTNGTGVIVPAIEGKVIEITGYTLAASGAAIVRIRSSGTDIFGPVNMAANGSISNSNISIKGNSQEPIVLVSTSLIGGFVNYRII